MIKFIFIIVFINLIIIINKKILMRIYYNLVFFIRFIYLFMYIEVKEIYVHLMMNYFGVDNYSFFMNILRM